LKSIDIYAIYCLTKDLSPYLEGGYFNSEQCKLLKGEILTLLSNYIDDSISLIDALALPDSLQFSSFGKSDGNIYKHYWRDITTAKGAFERPFYWKTLRTPLL